MTVSVTLGKGQTNLPAELRHRRGIEDGGEIAFIDLDDAALIVPGRTLAAKAEVRRVLHERYEMGLASLGDSDLGDQ